MTKATLLQRPQRFLLSFLYILSEHPVRLRSWNTRVVSEDQWPNTLIGVCFVKPTKWQLLPPVTRARSTDGRRRRRRRDTGWSGQAHRAHPRQIQSQINWQGESKHNAAWIHWVRGPTNTPQQQQLQQLQEASKRLQHRSFFLVYKNFDESVVYPSISVTDWSQLFQTFVARSSAGCGESSDITSDICSVGKSGSGLWSSSLSEESFGEFGDFGDDDGNEEVAAVLGVA